MIMGMALRENTSRRTTDEWEGRVGEQVRSLRRRAGLTQGALAKRSNVSIGALQNLEYGAGSRLATLVQVMRALGRGSWLEELAPPVSTSPMKLLEERQTSAPSALPLEVARPMRRSTESSQRSIATAGRSGAAFDSDQDGEQNDVSGR